MLKKAEILLAITITIQHLQDRMKMLELFKIIFGQKN